MIKTTKTKVATKAKAKVKSVKVTSTLTKRTSPTRTTPLTKVAKTTRTKVVAMITNSKGKFFTVTFTKKDNTRRTINANYKTGNTDTLGYLNVWSTKDKEYRKINPQTLISLTIDGTTYSVR